MSGPVAHGTPWFRRVRYVTAPLRSAFVPVRVVTGRTHQDSPCSILVVDDGAPLKLLLAGMLAEQAEAVSLGKFSILSVPALLRREGSNHDLVLARIPQILVERDYRGAFLRLPWIVDMWVRADEVARRRQRGRGTVASAYARWRQQGFVAVQRREPADLDRFDETMYQPFANARFGEAAATLDRATMRRALEHGTIVWVELEGRPVAAQLLERCGSTLHTVSVGTCLDPAAAQATGVLTALKVAASDLALETGLEWIDFGGCMPWLTDGVLQNKRQWGAELVHRGGLHRGVLASWARWTPAAAAFLAMAPICRHGAATFAVTTSTPRGNQAADKLGFNGLDRLVIVDGTAAGTNAVATPEVQRVARGSAGEILAQAGLHPGAHPTPQSLESTRSVPG
jgi:Acetyltransferase (GNAT) domain